MESIVHNLTAMSAQREFKVNTKKKEKTSEKLSSGYKINRAADDAAGLSLSETVRRQIRGLSKGAENAQDGVSLCQVADGALTEVQDMLQRITELSVKSANDTNSSSDRQNIQEEINDILQEIDRIGDTTTFNEERIFKGVQNASVDEAKTFIGIGDVPFSDFVLADLNLGHRPFSAGSDGQTLNLQAIVKNQNSSFNGKTFNLIFGSGSTSNSSFRFTDAAGNQDIIYLGDLRPTNYTTNGSDTWSRDFSYTTDGGAVITIKQTINTKEPSDTEKSYGISYEFSTSGNTADIQNLEFMFHADTAYNNNDRCEGYFIDGSRVNKDCIYSKADSVLIGNSTSPYIDRNGIPDSLSIVDVDAALAFSEKISFAGGTEPDSFSIGWWSSIDQWDYYDDLDANLGGNTNRSDLGFSLYYDLKDLTQKNSISFDYGIVAVESDKNLKDVPLKKDVSEGEKKEYSVDKKTWIQSGGVRGDGMYITIGEMNTKTLDIRGMDVSTVDGALKAIDDADSALKKISAMRNKIGGQQNRLEHTIENGENALENSEAAHSRIKDTDMAKEVMKHSTLNILDQIGQSMLAQANQSGQAVLKLLS